MAHSTNFQVSQRAQWPILWQPMFTTLPTHQSISQQTNSLLLTLCVKLHTFYILKLHYTLYCSLSKSQQL